MNNIPTNLNVAAQIPNDPKTWVKTKNNLVSLGASNNLAYTYYKGMRVYCAEEQELYEWREVTTPGESGGLVATNFIYPNGIIVNSVDYGNKEYNFFKVLQAVDINLGGIPDTYDLQAVSDVGNVTTNSIQSPEFKDISNATYLSILTNTLFTIGNVGNTYDGPTTRFVNFFNPNIGDSDEIIMTSNTGTNSFYIRAKETLLQLLTSINSGGSNKTEAEIFSNGTSVKLSGRAYTGFTLSSEATIDLDSNGAEMNGSFVITGKNGIDGNPSAPLPALHVIGGNGSNSILPTGVVVGGLTPEIRIEGGNGGNALTSSNTNIAGNGGDVLLIAGDGGLASGGTVNLPGNGGLATLQAGETWGGLAGNTAIKAGNGNLLGDYGGNVYIVPGFGNELDDSDESEYNGTIFINVSPNQTSIRGNTVIGSLVDDRINRLQVTGTVVIDDVDGLNLRTSLLGFNNFLKPNPTTEGENISFMPTEGGTLITREQVQVRTGWGSYADTVYTSGSPFSILANTDTDLPNNAGTIIDSQKAAHILTYYNGLVITGSENDGLLITIDFKVVPTNVATTYIEVWFDITGGTGLPTNLANLYKRIFTFPKGNGVERPVNFTIAGFTGSTWAPNGAVLKVRANGTADIYDIKYVLTTTHKGEII